MDESETRAKAEKIVDDLVEKYGMDLQMLTTDITAALLAASKPALGYVRLDNGEVRRVHRGDWNESTRTVELIIDGPRSELTSRGSDGK